jgi:EAL domain-containing protein (putative c-di-GMP-specific phosphodiesterase class I)
VVRLAGRIEERLREPFVIDGREVFITLSIGLAFGSGTENRPEDLLRNSDLAMYRAKHSGKDRSVVFRSEMKERTSRRLDLVGDLRQALRRPQEEFRVHYQPQVSLETGEIVGTEALIRWNHPSRGLILPSEFVPLAEETGLIVPLGWWVLREACRQCREWRAQYSTNVPLSVSVNLSGPQFQTFGLTERIRDILAETGLTPGGLALEITESALMKDIPSTIAALRWLKALGVGLSIDDFGTGYSSLAYMKKFPTDTIKVERSMVSGLDHDPGNAAIVSAMVTLAHALGLRVVAEGVETEAEAHELRDLGCDLGQGYYWCKPAPADEMTALLDAASRPKRRFDRRT